MVPRHDSVIASYRILGPIGEGGMGVVYRAEHVLLKRPAAIKLLQPELTQNQDMVARFFNEARAATAIRHPGIVEVFDFGVGGDGSAYIVMELLEGESLARRLSRGGPIPALRAIQLGRQIAGALAAAHGQGIIHRDLKPDNVFLVPDPEVPGGERIKLLDFGIAKLAAEPTNMTKTRTGALMGTPTYMAPEQCRGVQVDHRADLYSLGCILFECVCGRPPFVGEGVGDVLSAHIHVPPPPPRQLALVPPTLDALILRLLAKAPADRPGTAGQVIHELDGAAVDATLPPPALNARAPSVGFGAPTTLTGATAVIAVPTAAPARRGWRLPALLAGLGIAAIAVAAITESDPPVPAPALVADAPPAVPDATPAPVLAVVDAAPAAAPTDAATAVAVVVDSAPAGATVLANGVALGATPLRTERPVQAEPVTLVVRLAGYRDATLRFAGDRSIDTTVVLERKPRAKPAATPRPKSDADRAVNPY
jgi:tRNA A-37 threonylcarbamoyl transferase component Bud32